MSLENINDIVIVQVLCALPLLGLIGAALWRRLGALRSDRRGGGFSAMAAAFAVALVVPWTYESARSKQQLEQLGEYVGLSRYREALHLATSLVARDRQLAINGRPLADLAAELQRTVAALEAEVALPLSRGAAGKERLDRARALAMLGRSDNAMELLAGIEEPALAGQAASLLGLVCENQEEWIAAAEAFELANLAWQKLPNSQQRRAGIIEATRGLAYAQRKAGQYGRAELTYRRLLTLSPTADTHFLLAQFYEDTQDARQANVHARQAIALAPAVYQQQGARLINKLRVYQFGCWGVRGD